MMRHLLHDVLSLIEWNLPTIGQSDIVHGPLPFTRVDTTNVISLWGMVTMHQQYLVIYLKGCAKVIIISHISSTILQGNWTKFLVGFLITGDIGPCPHPCHTARTITSCSRDQLSPDIKVTLFERGKILVIGILGRARGR
jgi:hypothetical protein